MRIETYLKKNSENIAGVISLLSSTSLAFTGDSKSLAAAGIFTAAELTLARFGHKVEGYAAGATLFAVGDLTLAFSSAVQNETTLQTTLLVMAAAWGAGALRYPFEQAAKATDSAKLQKIADTLPVICGTTNLLLRMPGIYSAIEAKKNISLRARSRAGVLRMFWRDDCRTGLARFTAQSSSHRLQTFRS
jgi:hypothetical protein